MFELFPVALATTATTTTMNTTSTLCIPPLVRHHHHHHHHHSSSLTKNFIPSTSRCSIIHNRSSTYKAHRKIRGKQLRLLHNEILDNDDEWKEFHYILQQQLSNKSVSNATVKALLFDALDTFSKISSVNDINDSSSQQQQQQYCDVIQEEEEDDSTTTKESFQERTIEETKCDDGDDPDDDHDDDVLLSSKQATSVRIRLSVSTGNIISLKSQQHETRRSSMNTTTRRNSNSNQWKAISIDESHTVVVAQPSLFMRRKSSTQQLKAISSIDQSDVTQVVIQPPLFKSTKSCQYTSEIQIMEIMTLQQHNNYNIVSEKIDLDCHYNYQPSYSGSSMELISDE